MGQKKKGKNGRPGSIRWNRWALWKQEPLDQRDSPQRMRLPRRSRCFHPNKRTASCRSPLPAARAPPVLEIYNHAPHPFVHHEISLLNYSSSYKSVSYRLYRDLKSIGLRLLSSSSGLHRRHSAKRRTKCAHAKHQPAPSPSATPLSQPASSPDEKNTIRNGPGRTSSPPCPAG